MARPPAEARSAATVAVLGAETLAGQRVRAALEAAAVPGARVDLFGSADCEPTVSEYRGEARLIQRADPDVVGFHGVVFDCGGTGGATDGDALRLDLSGRSGAPLAHARLRPPASDARGTLAVPDALALVVLDLLEPLLRKTGFVRATVTVLRPAGDAGDPGVDELRRQVTGLLGFSDVPTETFGRRLAFNCYPDPRADGPDSDARVAREVRDLLGAPGVAVALRSVWVPVFFGHGIGIHVVPSAGAGAPDVDAAWDGADGVVRIPDGQDCSPQATTGDRRTLVEPAVGDGAEGVWVWAVADEAASASAVEAIRIARAAGRL